MFLSEGVHIIIKRSDILKSFFEYANYETLLTDPLKTKAILMDLKMPMKDISLINSIISSNSNLIRVRIFRVENKEDIDINAIVTEIAKDTYFTRDSIESFVEDLVSGVFTSSDGGALRR